MNTFIEQELINLIKNLKSSEIIQLNPSPNDTLLVKVGKSDLTEEDLSSMKRFFNILFPNNKTAVINLGSSGELNLTTIGNNDSLGCGTSFCEDCSCGKKEDFLNNKGE